MATLKDVAAQAGVSTATASLALNGGPVNEQTKARVLQCAAELRYIPNRIGRVLATGRSHIIQLVIMTEGAYTDTVRQTALFYYLLAGVLAELDEQSYTLRIDAKSYADNGLERYFEHVVGDNVADGIIVVPQFDRDHGIAEILHRARFPYVLLSPRRYAGTYNHVDMGNQHGGCLIANLFAATGRRRIAIINGPPTHIDAIERERGFSDGLRAGGLAEAGHEVGDYTVESGHLAMRRLLKAGRPDAVFCSNDYMAAGAMKAIAEAGFRIPRDIAVVGYDNGDVARAVTPALTSVDNHFFELGRTLAQELLSVITDGASVAREILPCMVMRDSH
ncbi:MAG: LacI family transcriptional regulator [Pseudomonadota bacterium]|nr:LacI family transcriptional regulator [Pseudomonadota bacterium]